ncbi:MAG: RNA-binding S4 domain-containing protein [Hyphomicrobiaceae bacterium]
MAGTAGVNAEERKTGTQRLDKWLWFARVTKTRTLAASLIQTGKVRVNRLPTRKPGTLVRADDVVTIAVHGRVRVLRVLAVGSRRGPAPEAAKLFEEVLPIVSSSGSQIQASGRQLAPLAKAGGSRPTKKERRLLEQMRSSERWGQ